MSARILVIEDDPGVRHLLVRGLGYEGHEVHGEATGEAGLAAVRANPPELIILDVMLPGMNALAVLDHLWRGWPQVPVLLLTSRTRPEEQLAGFECGADDCVTKPFASTCWRRVSVPTCGGAIRTSRPA